MLRKHVRFFVLLSACFLCASLANAQQQLVFSDDFSQNRGLWQEETATGRILKWTPGEYTMELTASRSDNSSLRSLVLNDGDDWSMQIKLRMISGSAYARYGLMLRSLDADSCYIFLLDPVGRATVIAVAGSRYFELIPWRSCKLTGGSSANTLEVVHQFDIIAFKVNGECIGSIRCSENPAFGDRFGFYVEDVVKIGVNSVRVSAEKADRRVNAVADGGLDLRHQNLGPNVNSEAQEINALVSADEKTLYMIRRDYSANLGAKHRDDIWVCQRQKNNEWGPAENIGAPLNTEANNSVISVSPDNNTLLLQGQYAAGEENEAGLSISHRTASGWSFPQTIRIDSFYNLNAYMEFCLSPDERVLLSSIERHDTKGSKDFYVSYRTSDTSFSVPHHIADLSTMGADMAPFIAADGTTLYFSSDGRAGYGSEDIFVTTRLDSTWLHWSEPKNVGPKINTASFDAYFHPTARGDSAYMITAAGGYGGSDIVRVAVPPEARPKQICLISGHVFDAKTRKPLGAGVEYENLSTNMLAGVARSNPKNGAYNIALPAGTIYGFHAEAENYYPISEQLDTRTLLAYQELNRDLYLVPIEKEATIRLNNLFFDFAKSDLRTESASELDRLIDFLKSHAKVSIQIVGHTDNIGDEGSNKSLSRSRAASVLNYLKSHGIAKNRLRSLGYGAAKPIDSNDTEEGRQRNRRVEFVIDKN